MPPRCLHARPVIVRKCPKPKGYPTEPKTVGEHILKRRRELGLHQIELATQLGVDEATVVNWENGHTLPRVDHYGKVIAFLGYDPNAAGTSLRERLVAFRRMRGLSIKKAARLLGVHDSTWEDWESGTWPPSARNRKRIERLLERP